MRPPKSTETHHSLGDPHTGAYSHVDSLAARLIRLLGPALGLIAVVVLVGIITTYFAHSDTAVIAITIMVVSTIFAVLFGRIKKVL